MAKQLVEQELVRRAQLPRRWTRCSHCGTRLQSKGMRPRQIQTLVGVVHWRRRVGRCPKGCQGSQSEQVIAQLADVINFRELPTSVVKTISNVHDYLQIHHEHIKYQQFKKLGLPLGSGMVESACKWLIQQRFKAWECGGVNMGLTICYICG